MNPNNFARMRASAKRRKTVKLTLRLFVRGASLHSPITARDSFVFFQSDIAADPKFEFAALSNIETGILNTASSKTSHT